MIKKHFLRLQTVLFVLLMLNCSTKKLLAEQQMDTLVNFIFPTSIMDGWHLSANVGLSQSWSSVSGDAAFFSKTNPSVGFTLGKYVTPVNDFRFQLLYSRNTGVYGKEYCKQIGEEVSNWHFHSLSFGLQYLPNLTNLFSGYRVNRKFTVSAMSGICMERTFGYASGHPEIKAKLDTISVWAETAKAGVPRWLVGIQFGVLGEYKYKDYLRFSMELSTTFLDDIYDGHITDQGWDGHFNLMAGVSYQLGWRPIKRNMRLEKIDKNDHAFMVGVVAPIRFDTVHQEGPVVQQVKEVSRKVTYVLVSMQENRSTVSRLQQANVYTAATLWTTYHARGNKTMIFVTDSQKRDDELFQKRAWDICELLSTRWQVDAKEITVMADESRIDHNKLQGYDHYIIITINENKTINE